MSVRSEPDGTTLLYIDRQLVHEVTSPQAFEGSELADVGHDLILSAIVNNQAIGSRQ